MIRALVERTGVDPGGVQLDRRCCSGLVTTVVEQGLAAGFERVA